MAPSILSAFRRVLVLAPHTDDTELGAGGLLARLVEGGAEVREIAFSIAEISLPEGFAKDTLLHEVKAAGEQLGIARDKIDVHRFPTREFPAHRQAILEILVAARREFAPDLVLAPATTDVHQDHATVATEAVRAFKGATLWGYELPWNNLSFSADTVVEIEAKHLDAKKKALAAYASQAGRAYVAPEFVEGWARTRGVTVGVPFAEAFEVVRQVVRR